MELEPCSVELNSDAADNSFSGLGHHLEKSLRVQDEDEREVSDEDDTSDLEEENDLKSRRLYHAKSELGWPSRRAFSPSISKMFNSNSSSEEDEEQLDSSTNEPSASARLPTLPSPSSLVSAMKGSREKHGMSPRKLTVTWAPDVYDPAPSSPSQMLSRGTKQQKMPKKEKFAEKKGQKGKGSSRGASGKDSSKGGGGRDKKKKQHRRVGKSFNTFGDDDDEI